MLELQKFLREPSVVNATGLSRSAIWRMIQSGEFPEPVKLTKRSVAWLESDVIAWQRARIEAQRGFQK